MSYDAITNLGLQIVLNTTQTDFQNKIQAVNWSLYCYFLALNIVNLNCRQLVLIKSVEFDS